jgi:dienelactone hydrolase
MMKFKSACSFIPFLALATVLTACGGGGSSAPTPTPSPTPTPPPASSVALTVVNGVGPTSAQPGSQVELWSTLLPQSQVLVNWTGGSFTPDDEEWHTTLNVPASNATLTANVMTLNIAFTTRSYTAPTTTAKTARFWVPANPRGLILMLHGTGGSSNFIEMTESRAFALKAISKGYAVLAPEAEEVAAGDLDANGKIQWDTALNPANIDFRALDTLLGSLVSSGVIPANLPTYVMGMSNGGAMAVSLGSIAATPAAASFPNLRFKAVISYCAQGNPLAVGVTTTPSAFYLCANDENENVSNAQALANSQTLVTRGVPTAGILHPATPLYNQRFIRVAGVSQAQSLAIANELRAGGFVDSNGFFTAATTTISTTVTASPASFPTISALTPLQRASVLAQIAVMRAEHQFFSDWTSRSLRWFAAYP